jgi:NAD(P)-dependent dehydrogenase (short-subunit alcohol dehydrogenase family)
MNVKTVVITGASKGIGRATALHLAKSGFTVFAGVRAQADADSLRAEANGAVRPVLLDISDSAQIAAAVETVRAVVGEHGLSALVNNAGIAVPAPLEFMPLDDFRHQIEINLTAQLAVTQAFLPCLRQARGRIVNVSSIGGRVAGGMLGAYHASKFALEALSDALRIELAPAGIDVVIVEPGNIATPIWESGAATFERLLGRMSPQVMQVYGEPIAKTRANVARSSANATSPETVARTIAAALTARRPRTRYLVGLDARIAARILANLPARLRDRAMNAL